MEKTWEPTEKTKRNFCLPQVFLPIIEHNGMCTKQINLHWIVLCFFLGNYIYNLYQYNVHACGINSLLKEHPKSKTKQQYRFVINANNTLHINRKETF